MEIIITKDNTALIHMKNDINAVFIGIQKLWPMTQTSTTIVKGTQFTKSIGLMAKHFKQRIYPPSDTDTVLMMTDISEAQDRSIMTWYDNSAGFNDGTQYWYSNCNTIYLNPDSSRMFYNKAINDIDLSKFDTSKVTNMSYMFSGMRDIITLDISNFDTSNVTNMGSMFRNNTLTNIVYGPKFTNDSIKSTIPSMFVDCAANRPEWTNGTWDANGTFIKNP